MYRGINDFKKGYQPGTNIVKDEKGDLVADCHSILARWRNYLNNVRRDASRHFRNKKKACLKAKIEELETNSKLKNVRDMYRDINDFKKGYQPRTNIVKDEKGN
jgi:hypothetical protein